MRALVVVIVAIMLVAALKAEAPLYSAASIVNAADNQSGMLAPNTIATIYGTNLAYGTHALSANDIAGGVLPTVFAGTDAHVLIGPWEANLFYVSPTQINFLVPANLLPGSVNVTVVVDSLAGPAIPIQLAAAAPALFQLDLQNAIATRADGSVVTPSAPAQPGEVVVLYAAGLGQTAPPQLVGTVSVEAARLTGINDFSVILDGAAVDPSAISYAGIAPGFAGLYQINLTLPTTTNANPQIQLGLAGSLSPSEVSLPVQP
jgi:uncharacterized protein (TIGR03437 family)